MKKEEFLSELESRLSGLPSEDINAVIFYIATNCCVTLLIV